jgi:hypothetical protein
MSEKQINKVRKAIKGENSLSSKDAHIDEHLSNRFPRAKGGLIVDKRHILTG